MARLLTVQANINCYMSNGLAGAFHSNLLGVYTLDDYNNGQNITKHSRYVFRQIDGENFLYYWDWGPNSGNFSFEFLISITTDVLLGTNWMVSDKYWENNRAIESTSMEYFGQFNVCVEDVHRNLCQHLKS